MPVICMHTEALKRTSNYQLIVYSLFIMTPVLLSSHAVTVTAHLISLLSTPAVSADSEVFLQALSTLHVIIGGSRDAVLECRREEHHLRALCDQWLRNVENEVGTWYE